MTNESTLEKQKPAKPHGRRAGRFARASENLRNRMRPGKSVLIALLAIAGFGIGAGRASAQASGLGKDWNVFGGLVNRPGHNGDPNNSGPGQAFVRWYVPSPVLGPTGLQAPVDLVPIVVDNTDFANTTVPPFTGGPYDRPPYVAVTPAPWGQAVSSPMPSLVSDPTAAWGYVPQNQEAFGAFVPTARLNPATNGTQDFNPRFPSYFFTRCTASAVGTAPNVAANPADLRVFEWDLNPDPALAGRSFGLYMYLPIGPTFLDAGLTQPIFPQRYYVVEIDYGTGQSFVDVVDTLTSGTQFVRLGAGGKDNNIAFPWDGVNPIRIKLFNTVPRDANGNLLVAGQPSNYCVYADAARGLVNNGFYAAGPVGGTAGGVDFRVIAAHNDYSTDFSNPTRPTTFVKGTVTSYNAQLAPNAAPTPIWKYQPLEASDVPVTIDNLGAVVTGNFASSTVSGRFQGTDYDSAPIPGATADSTATYTPNLNDGSYDVYAFISGDNGGALFGTQVQFEIHEGSTITTIPVNESTQTGWVRIGTRSFVNDKANNPLTVVITDASGNPADIGKQAYADAIRFVGAGGLAVTSTPLIQTVGIRQNDGTIKQTRVAVVSDERGYIHCLDAAGNGDGTTTEYWSYPSIRNQSIANWKDPNTNAANPGDPLANTFSRDGQAGVTLAQMPPSFDISSALVQTINGQDYLFIGATNGRVYSINMSGRGDFNKTTQFPGTTWREWTYPDDYPAPSKTALRLPFRGSLVFGSLLTGPTIFAPAEEGRIFALDAIGDTTKHTTSPRWTFPALTSAPVGKIFMTPALDFGKLYFGTARLNDTPGQFYALNSLNGSVVWSHNAVTPFDMPTADDYICSPCTVSKALLDAVPPAPAGDIDTVYALNQNNVLYAFDAATGAVQWQTDEAGTGSIGGLVYTTMTDIVGLNQVLRPMVLIPGLDARVHGILARGGDLNRFGGREAQLLSALGVPAPLAVSQNFLFVGDSGGLLRAFASVQGPGQAPPDIPGVDNIINIDNPQGDLYRKAKIRLLTRAGYQGLRLPNGVAGHLAYNDVASTVPNSTYVDTRSAFSFEWGETVYLLAYDFPFQTTTANGAATVPPQVEMQFTMDGKVVRAVAVEARQFENPATSKTFNQADPTSFVLPSPQGDTPLDGYSVLAFTFQGGGPNAIPPGDGTISLTLRTSALQNSVGALQEVALDARSSRQPFTVANPLAIAIQNPNDGAAQTIGDTTDPSNAESAVNGSPDLPSVRGTALLSSAGIGNHGQTASSVIAVIDRSLMTLISPDGLGVQGVRIQRTDLGWQGGTGSVLNPLDPTLYPGFEELPTNLPNTSLDYPDLQSTQVRVTKDPGGNAEDPVQHGVSLLPPLPPSGAAQITDANRLQRQLQGTKFEFDVDLPKYQPANLFQTTDAQNATESAGYLGRFNVFVDSNQNGVLDTPGSREAYRGFSLSAGVAPDQRLIVTTPTLDLGSLAAGSGYGPALPGAGYNVNGAPGTNVFQPWPALDPITLSLTPSRFQGMFKPFNVLNEGNVNLRHVRIEKGQQANGQVTPLAFVASADDPNGWLNGSLDIWGDIDATFAPAQGNYNEAIIQKPRVGDRIGTALSPNPLRQDNANLGVLKSPWSNDPRFTAGAPPRLAVSVPLGFPAGKYDQKVHIIDNDESGSPNFVNEFWDLLPTGFVETYSDPPLDVSFTVRESRGTGDFTKFTAPVFDVPPPNPNNVPFSYSSLQPTSYRDAFGSLVMAYASNRPNDTPAGAPAGPVTNDQWRIYVGAVGNAANFTTSGITGAPGPSPLRDLRTFTGNAGGSWVNKSPDSANGYPAPATDLNALFGGTVVANTAKFASPTFPQRGDRDPFFSGNPEDNQAKFTGVFMAFVGNAQVQTGSGAVPESKVFLTQATTAAGGSVSLSAPIAIDDNPAAAKGKPSIVQTRTGAFLFYSATSTSASDVFYTRYLGNGKFGPTVPLDFGSGFAQVEEPSASARLYQGVSPNTPPQIVDLTFSAQLRGFPNNEIFLGRMRVGTDANGFTLADRDGKSIETQGAGTPFMYLPQQSAERIVNVGGGKFRARGVLWDRTQPVALVQVLDGTTTNLLVDGTVAYDRQTGIISADSALGGKVYIDPNLGTVKFSSATPSNRAELRLTYTPTFLRISAGGGTGYSSPSALWDGRFTSDATYWRTASGAQAGAGDVLTNDRYFFEYGRAAAGSGQASRPYMETFRLGVRLPTKIDTDNNGNPAGIAVSGNRGPYQLDPANGRIYFTAMDEDSPVRVQYTGVDDSNNTAQIVVQANVSFVLESDEQPVSVEQAVNEANVTATLDPFTYLTNNMSDRRPPLVWLIWTSTRSGAPDVYFESINPRLSPVITGK